MALMQLVISCDELIAMTADKTGSGELSGDEIKWKINNKVRR